jgi:hypothetical protein
MTNVCDVPEDARLERFLYGCKLNVERTQRVLDTYYMVRATVPEFFRDRDPLARDMQLSFQHLHYVPLPVLTPLGYRPTLLRLADCDVNNFDVRSLTTRIVMSLDARLLEERCLNNVMLVDLAGFTMGHFAKMSPTLTIVRKALLCIQDAFPMRMAQVLSSCLSQERSCCKRRDRQIGYMTGREEVACD